jgi:hypothetical protein
MLPATSATAITQKALARFLSGARTEPNSP